MSVLTSYFFFFFSSRRRHTRSTRDWSSDVCSSDLDDLLFNNGAYAEYIRIPRRIVQKNLVSIPEHVSFSAAAMVEPLACVLLGAKETGISDGDTIAIIGAGPIGLMFIQVAKAKGARVITVVRRNEQAAIARRFGADEVVVLSETSDAPAAVRELTESGRGPDVLIEAVGKPEA